MPNRRVAVILAGGSGERFWPVSTRERPKQFLRLTDPERSLLREAAERAAALVGWESTYVSTGRHLASATAAECTSLPPENVLAEPTKRNTLGALVWVAASLIAKHPDDWAETTVAVLTADHRIAPEPAFHETVRQAMSLAEESGGLVTIGIPPDRPETGYGYIELGEGSSVRRFTEKPDAATAAQYLAGGRHLWNSGMFFWTLAAFMAELVAAEPEAAAAPRGRLRPRRPPSRA
jgi:mannose-1-phosphate guanylyltransferase